MFLKQQLFDIPSGYLTVEHLFKCILYSLSHPDTQTDRLVVMDAPGVHHSVLSSGY